MLLIGLTLNLIVRTQQDVVGREQGSGGGDDEDELSGGGRTDKEVIRTHKETTEGSAGGPDEEDLTTCQRQAAKMPSAFSPKCTQDGEFEPVQCNDRSRECWCVDKEGKEKPGSRLPHPNRPRCTARPEYVAPSRKPPGASPDDRKTSPPVLSYTPSDGDFDIDDASTPKPFTPEKTTQRRTSKLQTTTSAFQEHDKSDVNAQKPGMFSFIFKDPLILAGIIGGAVLALLCIVLLIMFTIYRMRKKDEGSYALDEPKKSYGFAYTRARDQEFFA